MNKLNLKSGISARQMAVRPARCMRVSAQKKPEVRLFTGPGPRVVYEDADQCPGAQRQLIDQSALAFFDHRVCYTEPSLRCDLLICF